MKIIGKLKKGLCLYAFNAIISFWMFKYEVSVNFSDDKIKSQDNRDNKQHQICMPNKIKAL